MNDIAQEALNLWMAEAGKRNLIDAVVQNGMEVHRATLDKLRSTGEN